MSNRAPSLIVVSAPSGTGKSTVVGRVLEEVGGLRFSISYTTRERRAAEKAEVDYHFVEPAEFEGLRSTGRLLEWAEVHGHLYGTGMAEYERAQADGVDLILDIDVQGAAKVRRALPEAVMVFLLPPSFADLERRLRGRASDDAAVIERRLEKASQEIRCYPDYDFVIVNDDLERCVESLKAVVRAARCRTGRMEQLAQQILSTFETPLRRT